MPEKPAPTTTIPYSAGESHPRERYAAGGHVECRTSELIVSQARIPPAAESAAQATIATWKPSVIAAGS